MALSCTENGKSDFPGTVHSTGNGKREFARCSTEESPGQFPHPPLSNRLRPLQPAGVQRHGTWFRTRRAGSFEGGGKGDRWVRVARPDNHGHKHAGDGRLPVFGGVTDGGGTGGSHPRGVLDGERPDRGSDTGE